MNRKKTSKIKTKIAAEVAALHRYDDISNWLEGDFQQSPWTPEQMQSFQKRIDSAFGAENAIVVCWSADRKYGDIFLNEKGDIEQKPPLYFAQVPVNSTDYFFLSCPRFLLMEVYHGSQLEDSWESGSWANDENGTPHRIRPEKPPQYFYSHLRVIADHEHLLSNGVPACCERLWQNGKRVCYGKYREPDHTDIEFVGRIAENMKRAGVGQRNDSKRDAKVLLDAQLGAQHFMQQAAQRKANAVKEMMMAESGSFFQSILDERGSTMSAKERDEIVLGALEAQDDERFSRSEII